MPVAEKKIHIYILTNKTDVDKIWMVQIHKWSYASKLKYSKQLNDVNIG